ELVAVKKYTITDKKIINLSKQKKISARAYIKQLAQKELEIGQLTDHPNIVKIREVFFEDSSTYIVMDYVEAKTFDCLKRHPSETRKALMQQFLSVMEHLLLRNIIIDDLRLENILISPNGNHLTLVGLGKNKMISSNLK